MQWIQPVLTGNNSNTELIVSSGGGADSAAWKAFDSSATSYLNAMNSGAWLQIITAKTIEISAINITSRGCLPRAGIFQISYDEGETWQDVGTWTDTLGTGNTADIVFNSGYPVGNYFRFLSQGKSLASSYNADFCNVTITAENLGLNLDGSFSLDFDTSRKLSANVQIDFDTLRKVKQLWRYENFGTADLLSVEGVTIQLDDAIFKSAFSQSATSKCFDIPATDEIWIKFDVFSTRYGSGSSSYRWWACNDATNGNLVDGICSNGYAITFWSSNSASSSVQSFANKLYLNTLQTILLHMVSGETGGIIEAWLDGVLLYTYTGNVNNGNDFDNFYLQAGNSQISFSNVIISNFQISLNENTTLPFDTLFDLQRKVLKPEDFVLDFDLQRNLIHSPNFDFDTCRQVIKSIEPTFDTYRNIIRTVNLYCDTIRKIPYKVILAPAENLVIDKAVDYSTGIQSFSISISQQQLTDQINFTTTNPVQIMQQVAGQYLDYIFSLRVESTSQSGILTTCHCCSDIDDLLFTQVAYKLSKETWQGGSFFTDNDNVVEKDGKIVLEDSGKVTTNEDPHAYASAHIWKLAGILHKFPILLFDDFISSVDIKQEGVTYQDLISEIFGWTSRIPHKIINVFIRNNFLYVIQRGHEQNIFDLSGQQVAELIVQKSLVRTSFGVTRNTEDLERNISNGSNFSSSKGYWEEVLGNEITDTESETEDEPEEQPRVLLGKTVTTNDGKTSTVTSTYSDGSSETTSTTQENAEQHNTITTVVTYDYDSDGNTTRTETTTTGGDVDTKVVVANEYDRYKRLVIEKTTEYEWDGTAWVGVDSRTVTHSYSGSGQQHVSSTDQDGNINGSVTTSARHTDKPTPYDDKVSSERGIWAGSFGPLYKVEQDGHTFFGGFMNDKLASYVYQDGRKIAVVGRIWKRYDDDDDNATSDTTISGTLETVKLYDSSFPVYSEAKKKQITNDLKWLNRKTQETVSFDIYDFPHVFDFNDKIIFAGNVYFLESNTVTQTSDIFIKQSLTLIRWY